MGAPVKTEVNKLNWQGLCGVTPTPSKIDEPDVGRTQRDV